VAAPPANDERIAKLGLPPIPADLLQVALTHASFVNESGATSESNERLEFLGDAILGMIIARELYERYPQAGEGELTRLRSEIVRGRTLARAAARMGLGEHVILGRGEAAEGGRERERNLAGAFEAVIGAVYLSGGYRVTRSAIKRLLGPEMKEVHHHGAQIDAKSRLQHLVQARWHQPPEYVTVDEAPVGQPRAFTVEVRVAGVPYGRGMGSRKNDAQQAAARDAVSRLAETAEAQEREA
jgi:ribonuclease-3